MHNFLWNGFEFLLLLRVKWVLHTWKTLISLFSHFFSFFLLISYHISHFIKALMAILSGKTSIAITLYLTKFNKRTNRIFYILHEKSEKTTSTKTLLYFLFCISWHNPSIKIELTMSKIHKILHVSHDTYNEILSR